MKSCRNLFHSEKFCLVSTGSSLSRNNKPCPFVLLGKSFISVYNSFQRELSKDVWGMLPITNHWFLPRFTHVLELCSYLCCLNGSPSEVSIFPNTQLNFLLFDKGECLKMTGKEKQSFPGGKQNLKLKLFLSKLFLKTVYFKLHITNNMSY